MYYGSADILQVTCFPGCLWPVPLNSFGLHCASVRQSSSFFLWRGTCCHGQINSKPGFCTSCPRVALHSLVFNFVKISHLRNPKTDSDTQRRSNERTDGTGSVKAGLCSTACYSRQRTSTATSKWDIIAWTCLDKRIRKVWSVRGVWYAFSNIFSDRQSDEAKHIEHRRTLKLPRWGKIVRPQPRQRVVTLRAGEFIANALNIFGMDDRKIQKRGP